MYDSTGGQAHNIPRGAQNVLYVLLCILVAIVILVLIGFHPTL
jgi:hypothetical protein